MSVVLHCCVGDCQALKACIGAALAGAALTVKPSDSGAEVQLSHKDMRLHESNAMLHFLVADQGDHTTVDDVLEHEASVLRPAIYSEKQPSSKALQAALKSLQPRMASSSPQFLTGPTLTAADIAVFCTLLPCKGSLPKHCAPYMDHMLQQQCVQQGLQTMFGSRLTERDALVVDHLTKLRQKGQEPPQASANSSDEKGVNRVEGLRRRYSALLKRIEAVEGSLSRSGGVANGADALLERQQRINERIGHAEDTLGLPRSQNKCASASAPEVPPGETAVYKQLHAELIKRGVSDFRFVRVPGPYYDKPLEFRAVRVGAQSIHHLCKTMVMENTRAPAHVTGCDNPKLSKYYMVLVQYSAAINAEKLKGFVHKLANEVEPLSKTKFNMRMVAEDVSAELTGFGHNAVTPIGSQTRIPIIMSHRIAELPGNFFLGAGEVDLKVGMPARQFINGFADVPVYVLDCTV